MLLDHVNTSPGIQFQDLKQKPASLSRVNLNKISIFFQR